MVRKFFEERAKKWGGDEKNKKSNQRNCDVFQFFPCEFLQKNHAVLLKKWPMKLPNPQGGGAPPPCHHYY